MTTSPAGIIGHAQIDTATEEEAGSVEVRFIRRGPTGGTLSINARTENGARFRIPENSLDGGGVGLDYKAASITHNWSNTDMQPVSINIPLIDDLLADKDHAFGVAFDWYSKYTCGVDEETENQSPATLRDPPERAYSFTITLTTTTTIKT